MTAHYSVSLFTTMAATTVRARWMLPCHVGKKKNDRKPLRYSKNLVILYLQS